MNRRQFFSRMASLLATLPILRVFSRIEPPKQEDAFEKSRTALLAVDKHWEPLRVEAVEQRRRAYIRSTKVIDHLDIHPEPFFFVGGKIVELTRVPWNPKPGEYAFDEGRWVYTFNSADKGLAVGGLRACSTTEYA